MVERGWVKRSASADGDRRVVMIEVTATGRAALDRVARAAEGHLAEALVALDGDSRRRLHGGLGVLRKVFSAKLPAAAAMLRKGHRTSPKRRPYVSQ
jgi:DNA-binding MarR family transcriptional regulator